MGVHRIDVESAAEMYNAVKHEYHKHRVVIMAAAVADYRPKESAAQKSKNRRWHRTSTGS
jgi:phosphopantothenoylcysteine decarboxylase / phosphopantothenate---cysteine ligase